MKRRGKDLSSAPFRHFSIRASRFGVALIILGEGTLSRLTPLDKRDVTRGLGEGKKRLPTPRLVSEKISYDKSYGDCVFLPTLP